jgi:8-oxo-dGTP pyrophosphatase MutT (NUDIX family)
LIQPELTVAAIVQRDSRFLMVEELVHGQPVINQPAGHVEPGESLPEAVMREAIEETAWRFEPEAISGIYLWQHPEKNRSFLRVTFCGSCYDHDPSRELDTGIIRTLWLGQAELTDRSQRLRSPMVMRSIADFLEGNRLPCNSVQNLPRDQLANRAAVV